MARNKITVTVRKGRWSKGPVVETVERSTRAGCVNYNGSRFKVLASPEGPYIQTGSPQGKRC